MRNKWLWGWLVVSPALWAAPLCSNNTTLQDYINQNPGGCQLGNAVFSNFLYSYTLGLNGPDPGDPNVIAADVTVDAAGTLMTPTLEFMATWVASAGFQTQILLDYTVTLPGAPAFGATSADLTGTVQNKGGLPSAITSQFGLFPGGSLSPSLAPSDCGATATTCSDTVGEGSGLSNVLQITVGDLITLNSGGTNGASPNTATLTEFDQTFSQAPEPSTLVAVGLGLLGCGWAARRVRRA